MDHMKNALKQKMGKHVQINIHLPAEKEDDKNTDVAPMVKDSDESGVIKTSQPGQGIGQPQHPEGPMSSQDGMLPEHSPFMHALISQAPDHPASGKTLDSMAKEQMLAKMKSKKSLKV